LAVSYSIAQRVFKYILSRLWVGSMQEKKTVKLFDEQFAIEGWGEHTEESRFKTWFKENMPLRNAHSYALYKWLGKPDYSNVMVFDAGCGNGNRSALLAKKGFNVIGGDISPLAIKQAKKRFLKHKNVEFLNCDLHSVPFKENTFDYIVCFDVIEHVSKPDRVLNELNRVLKPGGKIILEYETTECDKIPNKEGPKITFLKG